MGDSTIRPQKGEAMHFMGLSASSVSSTSVFLVTDQKSKTWTVQNLYKNEIVAASPYCATRFRCNFPRITTCRSTCKHVLFICCLVLNVSEDKLEPLQNGHELDVENLPESVSALSISNAMDLSTSHTWYEKSTWKKKVWLQEVSRSIR